MKKARDETQRLLSRLEASDFETYEAFQSTEFALPYLRSVAGLRRKQRIAEAIRNFSLLAIAIDYLFKTFRPEGNNVLVSIALVTAAITSFYWAHEFRDRCERFKAIYLQHVKEAE